MWPCAFTSGDSSIGLRCLGHVTRARWGPGSYSCNKRILGGIAAELRWPKMEERWFAEQKYMVEAGSLGGDRYPVPRTKSRQCDTAVLI